MLLTVKVLTVIKKKDYFRPLGKIPSRLDLITRCIWYNLSESRKNKFRLFFSVVKLHKNFNFQKKSKIFY